MRDSNSISSGPSRRRARRSQAEEPPRRTRRSCLFQPVLYGGLVLFGFALGIGVSSWSQAPASSQPTPATVTLASPAAKVVSARVTGTAEPLIDAAILAGHYSQAQAGNAATVTDPGAICADGLREVDINLSVAQKTLALLSQAGYRTTLFEEFDSRLKDPALGKSPDFRARVFLSIHSDSCVSGPDYPLATGWKVAHAEPSDVPEEDDRLVQCIKQGYGAAVKPYRLSLNENSITSNMTSYHGFRSIIPTTPAAIIELGFIGRDREILTRRQDDLARGLATGLRSFLRGESCS